MTENTFAIYQAEKPTILLITSGYHLYREYLLKMISEYANVWLYHDAEPKWEHPYILGFTTVDSLNVDAMVESIKTLPDNLKIQGVICWDEIKMVCAAHVASRLGLLTSMPDAVSQCRDKHLTRKALAVKKVPQAESLLAGSLAEATEAAEHIGYPVICKPRALGASFGVSLVENRTQLIAAYEHASTATEDGVPFFDKRVLVEEFMEGPEISVDSVIVDGQVNPIYLARKLTGFHPHFEETGHTVNSHDKLLQCADFINILQSAHEAVGYTTGITHTELRLTRTGPKIIEINARLGGDMIPYIGWFATGINPGEVAVMTACGLPFETQPKQKQVAAIHFLYPETNVVVDHIEVDSELITKDTVVAKSLVSKGQKLILPPNDHVACRYAYIITIGEDEVTCLASARQSEKAFKLFADPLHTNNTSHVVEAITEE